MDFVFDWDRLRVSGTVNDEAYEYPLDRDFHDRVSIQYALMHDLMADTPTTEYVLMDGDELKQLEIRNIGKKRIKVPGDISSSPRLLVRDEEMPAICAGLVESVEAQMIRERGR